MRDQRDVNNYTINPEQTQLPARGIAPNDAGLRTALEISRKGQEKGIARVFNYQNQNSKLQDSKNDLICFSHLRWDFVYQRPQHLLSRFARKSRVFFFEEPIFDEGSARLETRKSPEGVFVVTPHLPEGISSRSGEALQRILLDRLTVQYGIVNYVTWYYTPMALGFSDHLQPMATVYDCMDELSAFKNAPAILKYREAELFRRADTVFTGGHSLYESKSKMHSNVHAFPSSIEREHFAAARGFMPEPSDQSGIPRPRLGFYGVIDERMDLELLAGIASARPEWQLVVIGPVVKIDQSDLPNNRNIHYLGEKRYRDLPAYLAGWDVAMLPFALNESTRFISPTKTLEYLAAGCPVVSTPIRDVVRPYGNLGLVQIASNVADFVKAAAHAGMDEAVDNTEWLRKADEFLATTSWDLTWKQMTQLIVASAQAGQRSALEVKTTTQLFPSRNMAQRAGAPGALRSSYSGGD